MLDRIVDWACGHFLHLPLLGFRFSWVLLLTSLPLDDRDDWLAVVFFPFGSAGLQLNSPRFSDIDYGICGRVTPAMSGS